jgi:hypothetical protein
MITGDEDFARLSDFDVVTVGLPWWNYKKRKTWREMSFSTK